MEIFFKLLLLILVLVLAFIPNSFFGVWFPFIIVLTLASFYGYWYWMYYVKLEDLYTIRPELKGKINFHIFCGLTPISNNDDITRGQLIVTDTHVYFFQRKSSKERTKKSSCKQIIKIQIVNIDSVEFKKIAGSRYGFAINYLSTQTAAFMSYKIKKKKKELSSALGFEY